MKIWVKYQTLWDIRHWTFFLNIGTNLLSLISIQTSIHMVLQKGKNREWFVTFWTRKLFLLASWLRCLLGFSSGKQKKQEWMWIHSKIASMWFHAKHMPGIGQALSKQAKNWQTIGQALIGQALTKQVRLNYLFPTSYRPRLVLEQKVTSPRIDQTRLECT